MNRAMKWALALAASIVLMFSACAMAAEKPLSGRGTSSSPYVIASTADWATFANDVAAGKSAGKYYVLTKNIEAGVPVGTEAQPFKGIFDGRNRTVTFKIDALTAGLSSGTAPFRYISGATIRNLNTNGTIVGYGGYTAGVVGIVLPDAGRSTIENCKVSASIQGFATCGGIVGNAKSSSLRVSRCVFSGSLDASATAGIVGTCDGGASLELENCLSTGTTTSRDESFHGIALKSRDAAATGIFRNCYYTQSNGVNTSTRSFGSSAGVKVTADRPGNGFCRAFTAVDGKTYYQRCSLQNVAKLYTYTGSPVALNYVVKNSVEEVVPPEAYTVSLVYVATGSAVDEAVDAGEYELTLTSTGEGGYETGTLSARFYVGAYAEVSLSSANRWYQLRDAIDAAQGLTYISVKADIACEGERYTFNIPAGKNLVIDLNGHTISPSGNLWNRTYYESIFRVAKGATVTLRNGTIRDITFLEGGGAIWNEGTLTLDGIQVANIYSNSNGGGIYNSGTLEMRSGSVTGCEAGSGYEGGGIYNSGTLIMNGGTIKDNKTAKSGGGIYNRGTMTMNGGLITYNKCSEWGGGIYMPNDTGATLNLNGGMIQYNESGKSGAGIHVSQSAVIRVSGSPVVSINRRESNNENLWLAGDALIQVTGPMADVAELYVARTNAAGTITSGYSASNSAAPNRYFHADQSGYGTILRNGEANFDIVVANEYYYESSWDGSSVRTFRRTTDDSTAAFPKSTTIEPGWYCVDRNVTVDGRVSLTGDTHVVLRDNCTLDVKGLYIPQGSTLYVYGGLYGTGRIYSHPSTGAGIGAYAGHKGGNIVIHGGTIEVTGGGNCAGIGSNDGQLTDVGSFTMFGGTVNARGGESGAGIGGGRACEGGNITIYGGTITARGGHYGAGIGGGNGLDQPVKGAHGGTITIWGGNITAIGGDDGAGIGGGEGGNAGTIVIHGGTVTATGGNNSAGIGCGEGETTGRGGSVTIDGGTVNATGGNEGAGIGSGEDGWIDAITISGGTVTANGGRLAAAIGGGNNVNSGDIVITSGEVVANRNSDNGFGIGSGYHYYGGTNIYLGVTGSEGNSIRVTASSFNGFVTLNQPFEIDGRSLPALVVADNSVLTGGTLIGKDDTLGVGIFQPWKYGDHLPEQEGSYYLLGDVTLEVNAWSWNGGTMNLDLNGHTIKGKYLSAPVISVNGGTLNLFGTEGGGITETSGNNDAVYVAKDGTFNMYGGTISGASGSDNSGVNVDGSFHMAGGTVTGNRTGITVGQQGALAMSGSVRVTDNERNAVLAREATIKIKGVLSEDSRIGLSKGAGIFTDGLPGNGDVAVFFCDRYDGKVGLNKAGEGVLGVLSLLKFAPGDENITGTMEATQVILGSAYTLPECGFTAPEGVEFIGWQVGKETLQPGDVIEVTSGTTVTALWQGPWTITFDANGGEGEMEAVRVNADNTSTLPENGFTAPEGMTFAGWLISMAAPQTDGTEAEAANVLNAGDVISVSADTTLVAQWQAPEETETPEAENAGVTVTLQVVNGAWEDGTREARVITLSGSEGEELRLNVSDIPNVTAPDEGYGPGSWDVEPPIYSEEDGFTNGEPITGDVTYTYTYAPISAEASDGQPAGEQTEEGVETEPAEESAEQPAEESAEQPAEESTEQPAEESAEQPAEESTEQPVEESTEQPAEEPAEKSAEEPAEKFAEESAEQPAEESAEKPAEEPAEQPAEEPAGQPVEESAEQAVEQPAEARMCTIAFNGGGADGEMDPVQAAEGSEYTVPECAYDSDGLTFDVWEVKSSGRDEPYGCRPGEKIIVDGDMTFTACWLWDEAQAGSRADDSGENATQDAEEAQTAQDAQDNGLEIEYEASPSEVGSVFSGAGIAAIVAAVILVISAAGIAVTRRKKK